MRLVQLNELIIQAAEVVRPALGGSNMLATSLSPNLWPVRINPGQVQATLVELASRARDANPRGGRFVLETRNIVREEHQSGAREAAYVQLSIICKGFDAGLDRSLYAFVERAGGYITNGNNNEVNLHFPRAQD